MWALPRAAPRAAPSAAPSASSRGSPPSEQTSRPSSGATRRSSHARRRARAARAGPRCHSSGWREPKWLRRWKRRYAGLRILQRQDVRLIHRRSMATSLAKRDAPRRASLAPRRQERREAHRAPLFAPLRVRARRPTRVGRVGRVAKATQTTRFVPSERSGRLPKQGVVQLVDVVDRAERTDRRHRQDFARGKVGPIACARRRADVVHQQRRQVNNQDLVVRVADVVDVCA